MPSNNYFTSFASRAAKPREVLLLGMSINPLLAWSLVVTLAVAVIALTINLQWAAFIGLFALLGVWSWQWPLPAFYLLIVVAPLLPMFKITQTVGTITLLKDVIIVTLFLKLFLLPLAKRRLPYRRNILLLPLVALVAWVSLATVQSDSFLLGLLRARDIVLYLLLYFVVLYLPRSRSWYAEALMWFLASAAIVGGLGWYQFFIVPESTVLRFNPAQQTWIPRVSSIMAHPSILGQYLVIASTLLIALLSLVRNRFWFSLAALLLVLLPLVYFTFSRAVWLGYAAGLAAMAVAYSWAKVRQRAHARAWWPAAATAVIGVVIIGALAAQFTNLGIFVRSAFDPTYASNAERLEFLARLIAPLTPVQALFGAGLGDVLVQNFREVDVSAFDVASGSSRAVQLAKNLTLVDNQYLKTFIEMGLMGLLIYGWLYLRLLKGALSLLGQKEVLPGQIQNSKFKIQTTIGLWGLGFLAAWLIQGFFIDIWDIFPTNVAFWIIAALVSREQIAYSESNENG